MKKWQCIVCGLIYNEADGWPDDGIAPGTAWQDVPEDWLCRTAASARWTSK
jgi:rubredoxin